MSNAAAVVTIRVRGITADDGGYEANVGLIDGDNNISLNADSFANITHGNGIIDIAFGR